MSDVKNIYLYDDSTDKFSLISNKELLELINQGVSFDDLEVNDLPDNFCNKNYYFERKSDGFFGDGYLLLDLHLKLNYKDGSEFVYPSYCKLTLKSVSDADNYDGFFEVEESIVDVLYYKKGDEFTPITSSISSHSNTKQLDFIPSLVLSLYHYNDSAKELVRGIVESKLNDIIWYPFSSFEFIDSFEQFNNKDLNIADFVYRGNSRFFLSKVYDFKLKKNNDDYVLVYDESRHYDIFESADVNYNLVSALIKELSNLKELTFSCKYRLGSTTLIYSVTIKQYDYGMFYYNIYIDDICVAGYRYLEPDFVYHILLTDELTEYFNDAMMDFIDNLPLDCADLMKCELAGLKPSEVITLEGDYIKHIVKADDIVW